MFKLALIAFTLATSSARLTGGPENGERDLTLVATYGEDYLGTCVTALDCNSGLVCNQIVGGKCDYYEDFKANSLCTSDDHCSDGDIQYCNHDPSVLELNNEGLGLCELTSSPDITANSKKAYLETCTRDADCDGNLVCNSVYSRCDKHEASERWSLCKSDSDCNSVGSTTCNLNSEPHLKNLGFGLCNRLRSGQYFTLCTQNSHCNGRGNVCARDTGYGKMCGKWEGMECAGGYQCASGSCTDGTCDLKDESCWDRTAWSYSARAADCIPGYFLGSYPSRSHTHCLADDEMMIECGDQFYHFQDSSHNIAKSFSYSPSGRCVTGKIENREFGASSFCFNDDAFAVGCYVSKYIC